MRQIIFLDEATKMNKLIAAGKLDQSKLTPMERAQFQAHQHGQGTVRQTVNDARKFQQQAGKTAGEAQAANNTLADFNKGIAKSQIKYGGELKRGNPHDVNNLSGNLQTTGNTAVERTQQRVQGIRQNQQKVESQGRGIIDRTTGGIDGYNNRNAQYNQTVDADKAADQLNGNVGPAWKYQKTAPISR